MVKRAKQAKRAPRAAKRVKSNGNGGGTFKTVQRASKSGLGQAILGAGESGLNMIIPGAGSALRAGLRLVGLGAYRPGLQASPGPVMSSSLDRGVRIIHHEYLQDVSSSTGFTALSYPINPGLRIYPWLSKVAASFQKYILHGMVFYFKSTAATALNSTNTALGYVAGATQYNTYLPTPANKTVLLAISGARDGKPAEDNVFPVECAPSITQNRVYYVRDSAVSDDLAKYDHGKFFLVTGGSQAVATVGELHVAYDITLIAPDPMSGSVAYRVKSTNVSVLDLFANPVVQSNSMGGSIERVVSGATTLTRFTFNPKPNTLYFIQHQLVGTNAMEITYPTYTLTGGTLDPTALGGGSTCHVPPGLSLSVSMAYFVAYRSDTMGTPFVLDVNTAAAGIPAGANTSWLQVLQAD